MISKLIKIPLETNLIKEPSKSKNSKLSLIACLVNTLSNIADADELAVARAHLHETAEKAQLTNASLNEKLHVLHAENENVMRKIADTERYLGQLIAQEKALRDKVLTYEEENNKLDHDINETV